jgi:hypothetical protein
MRAIIEDNPNISKIGLRRELFMKYYGNDFNAAEREKIPFHLETSL